MAVTRLAYALGPMLAKPTASTRMSRSPRESNSAWSTTATAEWDSAAASNDEAGALGDHAEACMQSNGRSALVIDAVERLHRIFKPRMITVLVLILIVTAAATLS